MYVGACMRVCVVCMLGMFDSPPSEPEHTGGGRGEYVRERRRKSRRMKGREEEFRTGAQVE